MHMRTRYFPFPLEQIVITFGTYSFSVLRTVFARKEDFGENVFVWSFHCNSDQFVYLNAQS